MRSFQRIDHTVWPKVKRLLSGSRAVKRKKCSWTASFLNHQILRKFVAAKLLKAQGVQIKVFRKGLVTHRQFWIDGGQDNDRNIARSVKDDR